MNRKSIAHTTFATLAVLATVAAIRPAHAADAPPAPAAASDVATIAAGLEAPDAATRAKAAEALGARYPEAASAVPVLLDAARDEDAAVRAAAVRALRLLGRRGQEDAARAFSSITPRVAAFIEEQSKTIGLFGRSIDVRDYATLILMPDETDAERTMAALYLAAMNPIELIERDFVHSVALHDAMACIALTTPYLQGSSPEVTRAAVAATTILGRASCIREPALTATDTETMSSPTLLELLSSTNLTTSLAGFMLLAVGGPHQTGVPDRVLRSYLPRQMPKFQTPKEEMAGGSPATPDAHSPLRGLGGAAWQLLMTGYRVGTSVDRGAFPAVIRNGGRDYVKMLWDARIGDWSRSRPDQLPESSSVYAMGRDRELAGVAATSIPALLDALRADSPASMELLTPADSSRGDDRPPADSEPAEPGSGPTARPSLCVALAWLAIIAPPTRAPASVKALAASTLRRAMTSPNRYAERREAAAAIFDLADPTIVPVSTVLASLSADGSRRDGWAEIALLRALSIYGVPSTAVDGLSEIVSPRRDVSDNPPPPVGPTQSAAPPRAAVAAIRQRGASAELPILRRLAAIDALGAVVGDKAKAKSVLEPLTKDPDARVRYRAAKALRRLGA